MKMPDKEYINVNQINLIEIWWAAIYIDVVKLDVKCICDSQENNIL